MYIRRASSPSTVLWAFHTIQPSSCRCRSSTKCFVLFSTSNSLRLRDFRSWKLALGANRQKRHQSDDWTRRRSFRQCTGLVSRRTSGKQLQRNRHVKLDLNAVAAIKSGSACGRSLLRSALHNARRSTQWKTTELNVN